MIMLSDNIIIELQKLSQTWFGWFGCALILCTVVVCSNLFENEIDFFIFAKWNCELNVKGWRNLRDIRTQREGEKQP